LLVVTRECWDTRLIVDTTRRLKEAGQELVPHLRGWLHLGSLPVSVSAGIVLVSLSPSVATRWASAVFTGSASVLFGSSALLHRGRWPPGRLHSALHRLDHSSIYLLIAGTYTPFAITLLDDRGARTLLALIWSAALLGIVFSVFWMGAPRWLYLPVYITMGCAAILWLDKFAATASGAVIALMIIGGVLYLLGAVVYGLRRPNPIPHWFGFHEVFHSLTVAAFAVHYVGVSLVVYRGR
jgi:hemolysin III